MVEVKNWGEIEKKPFQGCATRQVFSGENTMVVLNILEPGFPPFPHSHPHEQLLCIWEGNCEVEIGEETFKMGPGDIVRVPPNAHHDLRVIGDKRVVNMDVFSPIREDYLG